MKKMLGKTVLVVFVFCVLLGYLTKDSALAMMFFFYGFLVSIPVAYYLSKKAEENILFYKEIFCTQCGHIGSPNKNIKGSGGIEFILWLCGAVPGLIYSMWRHGNYLKMCSACGSLNLIPPDSPVAKKYISDNEILKQKTAFVKQKPAQNLNIYSDDGRPNVYVIDP